ncbi:hypothetical protein [Nocardia sp. NPDC004722]
MGAGVVAALGIGTQIASALGGVALAGTPQSGPYLYNVSADRCITDGGPGVVSVAACAANTAGQHWTMTFPGGGSSVYFWVRSGNGRCLQHNSDGSVSAQPCTNPDNKFTDAAQAWMIQTPLGSGETGCTLRAVTDITNFWGAQGGWLYPQSNSGSLIVGGQGSWGSDDRVLDWTFGNAQQC